MKKMKLYLGVLFLISGCATATPYQPANYFGRGFKDQMLDKDKFRVSFKGNKLTERDTVETYLFYRAAEVVKKEGFQFFKMTNLETDRKTEYESISPVVYGQYAQDQRRFPYYIYGSLVTNPGGTIENTEYEAVAFVTMAHQRPKEKQESYYEASEVLKNLKSKIVFPEK